MWGIRKELMTEIKEERAKKESIKGEKIKTRKSSIEINRNQRI